MSKSQDPSTAVQVPVADGPVTRDRLYAEVWAEPMTKVAARYGVSGSFLTRVCMRLNVPRPQPGHWAKLAAGKKSPRLALPEARPGHDLEWSRDGTEPLHAPRALPKPPQDRLPRRIRARHERPLHHALIVGAQAHLDAGRESYEGYCRPAKKLLPDLLVSKAMILAALVVANELYLALEDAGYRVSLAGQHESLSRDDVDEREKGGKERNWVNHWSPYRPTIVAVGTVAIGLTLFEMSEEVEARYHDGKYVRATDLAATKLSRNFHDRSWNSAHALPSGRLCLQAYSPYSRTSWRRQWREAKPGDLQHKISSIVKELKREAAHVAELAAEGQRQAEIARQQWEVQQREWEREKKERRRNEAIKNSRDDLFALIGAWVEARRIEDFVKDVERHATNLAEGERELVLERLRRAQEFLGRPDPIQRLTGWKTPEERL